MNAIEEVAEDRNKVITIPGLKRHNDLQLERKPSPTMNQERKAHFLNEGNH